MTYHQFWNPLTDLYPTDEAKAIALMVMELRFGMTMTEVVCGHVETLDENGLAAIQQRLLAGEPVQYVLGVAEFGNRQFRVTPDVLIPRPETYELCQWAFQWIGQAGRDSDNTPLRVLDICTGSGCIACTLAAERPDKVQVWGWDISPEALQIARENAKRTHVHVSFEQQDALSLPTSQWHLIISNPPYICEQEKSTMECNVLDFEPAIALFVPNDDPLLFYRHIAAYAVRTLLPDGWLLFEINPLYASELKAMLRTMGFSCIESRNDQFGKERFIKACK